MTDAAAIVLGDDGEILLPAHIRAQRKWSKGTELVLVETDEGVLLTDRATALRRVRALVGDAPLVDELLAERRRAAAEENLSSWQADDR